MFSIEEKKKAIEEAIRVTKKHGKIFIVYKTNEAVMITYGLKKGNMLKLKEVCDENYKVKEIPEEIFSVNYVEEFNKIIKSFPVKVLNEVADESLSK